MEELDVSTVVRVAPERAFEFLVDFPGYAKYTEYLEEVRQHGDGGVGTTYDLVLSWWVVSYTARSRVTDVDSPTRIDWTLEDSLDASGAWEIEPLSAADLADLGIPLPDGGAADGTDGEAETNTGSEADGGPAPEGSAPASRIRFRAAFDRDSVGDANLGLPRFVSGSRLLGKVAPVARREAKTVIGRIVADLEDEPRDATLRIHNRPEFL